MRCPTISPKEAARLGWTRIDERPWSKCRARWVHRSGWRLEHCGHPTANWPWALYHPDGRFVGTGMAGPYRRPDFGRGWATLAEAMDLVARVECGAVVVPDPPYPEPSHGCLDGQLTKTEQFALAGNSVCPDVAAVLASANLAVSAPTRRPLRRPVFLAEQPQL